MKLKGLTEDVWQEFGADRRLYWGLFVTLLTFFSNFLIGTSKSVSVNLIISFIVTLYVTVVVSAERDYRDLSKVSKRILFYLSWTIPTYYICGLFSFTVIFYLYLIGAAIFPAYAEPLQGMYPELLIKVSFGLALFWVAKKQFIDTQVLQDVYRKLKNVLATLFSADGKGSLSSFFIFELSVVYVSTALTYFSFKIFDLALFT